MHKRRLLASLMAGLIVGFYVSGVEPFEWIERLKQEIVGQKEEAPRVRSDTSGSLSPSKSQPYPGKEDLLPDTGEGNLRIADFNAAKKMARQLYRGREVTFYCGCRYSGRVIDLDSCGYKPQNHGRRAYRVEWEHIVPAADFGRSFTAWRQGDPRCKDRNGKMFKGRPCARLVSPTFRRMEADLYNLVPESGEINQQRSHYPMGQLPVVAPSLGGCATKIASQTIEPRPAVRGFVARTYKYMDWAYPGHGIISVKNRKLMDAWDRLYPPEEDELRRARVIATLQGNDNPFVQVKGVQVKGVQAKGVQAKVEEKGAAPLSGGEGQ